MLKRVLLLATIILMLIPVPGRAEDVHLVINSFKIAGDLAADEFVEILNPGSVEVNITGWRLSKKTASGTLSNLLTSFPEKILAPGEAYKIGHKNSQDSPDVFYSTASSLAADNTIILADKERVVVDKVGMGKAGDYEEQPAENPQKGEILSRSEGIDTDNNYLDFLKIGTEESESGATSNPENLTAAFFDITITELMPNPEGPDNEQEWIEILNNGPRADLGGLVLRDKLGSPKEYKLPLGTVLESGSYLVVYSKESRISLNNTGDIVEIISPFGGIVDSTEVDYEAAPEGVSFALSGSQWSWTSTPTPGAKNRITAPPQKEKKSAVKKATVKKPKTKKIAAKEVLGDVADEAVIDLSSTEDGKINTQDKWLGFGLLGVAILSASLYTLNVNKEKVSELLNAIRKRYQEFRGKIRKSL